VSRADLVDLHPDPVEVPDDEDAPVLEPSY
jgi:hypothetical protein